MRKLAGVAVLIVIAVGFRLWNRSDDSKQVLADAKQLISEMPGYAENAAYLDKVLANNHAIAFDAAYTMGGRRTRAKFNDDKYLEVLFTRMADNCRIDGKTDLANTLKALAAFAKAEPSPPPP